MDGMDYWRLCDHLSVIQATFLIIGVDPAANQDYVDSWNPDGRPKGYDAVLAALQHAIQSKKLAANILERMDPEEFYYSKGSKDEAEIIKWPDWHRTTVAVDDLKDWLKSRGIRNGFFFPEGAEKDEFLDAGNVCYAPKLAAAVNAWKAVSGDEMLLKGRTPKQAMLKWLRENAHQYSLTDEDGKPIEQAIEEIAKVANWKPEGGAAKTPTLVVNNPPTQKKDKKTKPLADEEDNQAISF